MRITLIRHTFRPTHTHGALLIDGQYYCDTLEDTQRVIRNRQDKIIGHTAIPLGEYPVHWTYSPKFRRFLPEIKEVPWFTGIRIHAGNTEKDTEGCILVGKFESDGYITASRTALERLCTRISSAIVREEPVRISVTSDPATLFNAAKANHDTITTFAPTL